MKTLRDTYTEEISNTPSLPEGKSTPLKEGNFTEFDEILAEFGLSKDEYEEMSVEELAELEV